MAKIFNTKADLAAASLTAGQLTSTKGYTTAGDGGGATYLIKTAVDYGGTPDEYGDHTLANGNVAVLQHDGSVSFKWFGAVGDGATDDTDAIQHAVNYAFNTGLVLKGGSGTFSHGVISYTAISNKPITFDLSGATLKAHALSVTAFDVDGSTFRPKLTFTGGGVCDGGLLLNNAGVSSGTYFTFDNIDDLTITGGIAFLGGTYGDGKGDSGIVVGQCRRVKISGNHFSGWDDHGVYLTGGAHGTTQRCEDVTIVNNTFNNLSGALRFARQYSSMIVTGNVFTDVYNCVIAAGGNTNWYPGDSINISSNVVNSCLAAAFDLRYFNTSAIIS